MRSSRPRPTSRRCSRRWRCLTPPCRRAARRQPSMSRRCSRRCGRCCASASSPRTLGCASTTSTGCTPGLSISGWLPTSRLTWRRRPLGRRRSRWSTPGTRAWPSDRRQLGSSTADGRRPWNPRLRAPTQASWHAPCLRNPRSLTGQMKTGPQGGPSCPPRSASRSTGCGTCACRRCGARASPSSRSEPRRTPPSRCTRPTGTRPRLSWTAPWLTRPRTAPSASCG
mmetsp:Transcript_32809/g.77766  ORF Transcript_32809/g.77766 Transcript_32809/m.77766 type:complete len:226 (+) Transcript_32809:247-924(+)